MKLFNAIVVVTTVLGMFVAEASAARPGKPKPPPKNGSKLSAQQQSNLTKLKTDLEAMYGKSTVTAAQKQAVKDDMAKIMSGASKPSKESVQKLATDLSKAVADKSITPKEAAQLSQDVATVLNSANISQADAQKLLTDTQTLLKATKLTKADAQTIANDVKAIVTTAQTNAKNAK